MPLKQHVKDILRHKIPVIFRQEKLSQISELKFHLKKQVSGLFFFKNKLSPKSVEERKHGYQSGSQ